MNQTNSFKLNLKVYPFSVQFVFGDVGFLKAKTKHLEQTYKDWIEELQEGDHGFVYPLDTGGYVMWLNEIPNTPMKLGQLSHEIFHLVEKLFRRIDLPLTEESSEAYAYLIQYITQQVYNKLKLF